MMFYQWICSLSTQKPAPSVVSSREQIPCHSSPRGASIQEGLALPCIINAFPGRTPEQPCPSPGDCSLANTVTLPPCFPLSWWCQCSSCWKMARIPVQPMTRDAQLYTSPPAMAMTRLVSSGGGGGGGAGQGASLQRHWGKICCLYSQGVLDIRKSQQGGARPSHSFSL